MFEGLVRDGSDRWGEELIVDRELGEGILEGKVRVLEVRFGKGMGVDNN